jgi:2,3-bisphosphoglycerate-independent phosphoglycerate mutase
MSKDDILKKKWRPLALIILDGWGLSSVREGNACALADTPFFNELVDRYPSLTLAASGESVGLPKGAPGNSETGHLTLGAGRVCRQGLELIKEAIADKSFFKNEVLLEAVKRVKKNNSSLHLMGLIADDGTHANQEYLLALLQLAKRKKVERVFVHVFLDGRDTARDQGLTSVRQLEAAMKTLGVGEVASITGRRYALDQNRHWSRVAKAYAALVEGSGDRSGEAVKAIQKSYESDIYDEEFLPTVIVDKTNRPKGLIGDNDAVVFFNFRADRSRQLAKAFLDPSFKSFKAKKFKNLFFATFVEYEKDLRAAVVFPKEVIADGLGEAIARAGLKQLRVAETEKFAHVTYFFNGEVEEPLANEERLLIPSPRVNNYAKAPAMATPAITKQVVAKIEEANFDFMVLNLANLDMVGHTGDLEAAKQAAVSVDEALRKIIKKLLEAGGLAVIVADHGNAENMINLNLGTVVKEHTANPVPFVVVANGLEGYNLGIGDTTSANMAVVKPSGALSDVAPTILKLLGLPIPDKMTGRPLIV